MIFLACHKEMFFVHLLAGHRYCVSYEYEDRALIVSHPCLAVLVRVKVRSDKDGLALLRPQVTCHEPGDHWSDVLFISFVYRFLALHIFSSTGLVSD